MLNSFFGHPTNLFSVGDDSSKDGGSIVSSKADHHESNLSDVFAGLELIEDVVDFGGDAIGSGHGLDTLVNILGVDELLAVLYELVLDSQAHLFFNL